jgi:hypothetical protein
MTDPDGRPSRQDAFFDSFAEFLQRNAIGIALIAPVVLVSQIPIGGSAQVLALLVIYLGEAILYAFMRRGAPAGRGVPGPGLQFLYGVLAMFIIVGGLAGLAASRDSLPIVPILVIVLGVGIIVWVGYRVSRASRERPAAVVGRMAGIVGQAGGSMIRILVFRLILAAVVAGVTWLIAVVTKLFG